MTVLWLRKLASAETSRDTSNSKGQKVHPVVRRLMDIKIFALVANILLFLCY
jgi:hypothetical protein